ncbi:zinc finger protein 830-like [Penaeus monodon]|uniref:zinc finger protein 830-like n=1 Tax=Penaeus monodon TaxID=6687 RepID=UPI0018A72C3E|nr:zinc finger protein 830-like [Penaeus monodon]
MSVSRGKPDDIKKLMQEQIKTKAITKQVDSPYAKYNSRGQLMCIVCGTVVKSAIIWQAHVNKRSHLENLTRLKQKQQQLNSQQSSSNHKNNVPQKRAASPPPQASNKKQATSAAAKPKGILKKISTYSSSSDSEGEETKPAEHPVKQIKTEDGETKATGNGLPEGFFDEDQPPARPKEEESMFNEEQPKPKEPPKPNTSEVLPEGFFDDPVADAKARKVEYKDKEAEEWMSFMREVSAAEQVSRTIIEEDKEEAALATQIEQANEQIAYLEKVVQLDQKKTSQLLERGNNKRDSDGEEDSSDEEFVPVIWRTKNSLI